MFVADCRTSLGWDLRGRRSVRNPVNRVKWTLCNPEALGELFYGACIKQVKVCALDVITRFTSFDDYWQPFLRGQGSAPNYLTTRNHATNNAIRERLRRSLTTDPESAIELPARVWAVCGRR
jgi:hypothetical protein